MVILGIFIFGIFGMAVGSFLNVCIDRLPVGGSLLRPPSHCPACQHRLAPKDLVPVFSYLWLRGRCRYCRASIPQRTLWVELGTGLIFAFLWWQYGLTPQLGIMSFYFCLLIIILVVDLEQGLILNKVVYPAAGIALLIDVFPVNGMALIIDVFASAPGIVSGLIGGGVGLVVMLVLALVSRGGMGWGDVKMAGLMGAMVGFPGIAVALLLGIVGGGLVAGLLLALKIKGRKEAIAFGPFLSLATMVTLLWGRDIITWYLGFF